MLVNFHGYPGRAHFAPCIHTDQVRFSPGKINYAFTVSEDSSQMSLFFYDAMAARDLARRINEVADSIEKASAPTAEAV